VLKTLEAGILCFSSVAIFLASLHLFIFAIAPVVPVIIRQANKTGTFLYTLFVEPPERIVITAQKN
jgi:hypothetical protein